MITLPTMRHHWNIFRSPAPALQAPARSLYHTEYASLVPYIDLGPLKIQLLQANTLRILVVTNSCANPSCCCETRHSGFPQSNLAPGEYLAYKAGLAAECLSLHQSTSWLYTYLFVHCCSKDCTAITFEFVEKSSLHGSAHRMPWCMP